MQTRQRGRAGTRPADNALMQRSHGAAGQEGSITSHYGTSDNTYLELLLTGVFEQDRAQNKKEPERQTRGTPPSSHWLAPLHTVSSPCYLSISLELINDTVPVADKIANS